MLKKTLGFGFVAGTAMLAVALSSGGCSSTTTTTSGDAAADVKVNKTDGAPSETDSGATCPGTAPTQAEFDADPTTWKVPGSLQNVCSSADLTAFGANLDATGSTYADLTKGVSAPCATCLSGKYTDTTWPLVVLIGDKGGGLFNFGACFSRAANGSEACGRAVEYTELCYNASCAKCSDQASFDACLKDQATGDACSANFQAGLQAGCGSDQAKFKTLSDLCGNVTTAAAVLCGGGAPADAGKE